MENDKKVEDHKEIKRDKPKQIKSGKESIVILRNRGLTDVKETEEKYSEKFGCKVVILESNLDYVGKIDG